MDGNQLFKVHLDNIAICYLTVGTQIDIFKKRT